MNRVWQTSTRRRSATGWAILVIAIGFATASMVPGEAQAQQAQVIELEVFEIESEVPRRVARFFIQRDRLNYSHLEDQPSFLPELLDSVENEPF